MLHAALIARSMDAAASTVAAAVVVKSENKATCHAGRAEAVPCRQACDVCQAECMRRGEGLVLREGGMGMRWQQQ